MWFDGCDPNYKEQGCTSTGREQDTALSSRVQQSPLKPQLQCLLAVQPWRYRTLLLQSIK